MKVICIEGPSCAGKSTTVNSLMGTQDNLFLINKDKIKWLLSDYDRNNIAQRKFLKDVMLQMALKSIENNISLIIEGQRAVVDQLKIATEGSDIDFFYFNIEAPRDVILSRFQDRVLSARKNNIKISNTTEEGLLQIYENYHDNLKYSEGITLNTSKLSTREIVSLITKTCNL